MRIPIRPQLDIVRANPLGKIPALAVDGDSATPTSRYCEYLDSLAPAPALLPKGGVERMRTLTLAVPRPRHPGCGAAAGLPEAAPGPRTSGTQPWQARQQLKIDRAVYFSGAPACLIWKGEP